MANMFAKAVVGGSVAATLAAFTPLSAQSVIAHPQFGGTPVQLDPYNLSLAEVSAPSEAVCQLWHSCGAPLDQIDTVYDRFSGPAVYLDAYNQTLTIAAVGVAETLIDPKMGFALEPGYDGPRVWEGPISPDK